MYSQANLGSDVKGIEYHAYLKLNDGEKYFLTSGRNEQELEEKVLKIRKKLDLN